MLSLLSPLHFCPPTVYLPSLFKSIQDTVDFSNIMLSLKKIEYLVGGIPTPLKKYEFVSWDDYSQYMEK